VTHIKIIRAIEYDGKIILHRGDVHTPKELGDIMMQCLLSNNQASEFVQAPVVMTEPPENKALKKPKRKSTRKKKSSG